MNGLRLACNQSTNRDPVTAYDETTVREAAQRLCLYGLARLASGHGSRSVKYRHLAEEALGLGREELAVLAAVQRPISVQCIQEVAPAPEWKKKPPWFLLAEEDRMINPKTQQFMAERMGAKVRSARVDHSPMYTDINLVVDVIAEAAFR